MLRIIFNILLFLSAFSSTLIGGEILDLDIASLDPRSIDINVLDARLKAQEQEIRLREKMLELEDKQTTGALEKLSEDMFHESQVLNTKTDKGLLSHKSHKIHKKQPGLSSAELKKLDKRLKDQEERFLAHIRLMALADSQAVIAFLSKHKKHHILVVTLLGESSALPALTFVSIHKDQNYYYDDIYSTILFEDMTHSHMFFEHFYYRVINSNPAAQDRVLYSIIPATSLENPHLHTTRVVLTKRRTKGQCTIFAKDRKEFLTTELSNFETLELLNLLKPFNFLTSKK